MGTYDVQQVCLNGHQITDTYNRYPQHRKSYCDTCGEQTIHQCPNCNHPIRGNYHVDGVVGFVSETEVPTHCSNCGDPFPWVAKKTQLQKNIEAHHEVNHMSLVEQICSRFHLVSRQLKSRYNDRDTLEIEDEYDTQDLLHALLHIYFDDIRPEEWTPSYAGSCSRVDFLLKQEGIVVEVKKTRKSLKAKHVGEQLIVDIAKYRIHPDCKKLICFVYDPEGWVSNPRGLENDLNQNDEDLEVKVMIIPKGH